jgi:hypothetical protein
MQKELIRAIHYKDVYSFFASHDLLEELEAGKIRCARCADLISLKNFRAVTRLQGKLVFTCDKESCGLSLIDQEPRVNPEAEFKTMVVAKAAHK